MGNRKDYYWRCLTWPRHSSYIEPRANFKIKILDKNKGEIILTLHFGCRLCHWYRCHHFIRMGIFGNVSSIFTDVSCHKLYVTAVPLSFLQKQSRCPLKSYLWQRLYSQTRSLSVISHLYSQPHIDLMTGPTGSACSHPSPLCLQS